MVHKREPFIRGSDFAKVLRIRIWSGGVVPIAGVHLVRYWRLVPPRAGSRSRHRGRSCRAPHWTRAHISDARARHCASPLTQEASPSPFRRSRCEPWGDHGFGRAVRVSYPAGHGSTGVFPCLPTIGGHALMVTTVFAVTSTRQSAAPAHSLPQVRPLPEIAIAQDFMARPRGALPRHRSYGPVEIRSVERRQCFSL